MHNQSRNGSSQLYGLGENTTLKLDRIMVSSVSSNTNDNIP